MESLIEDILYNYPPLLLYGLAASYFMLLYFGIGQLFLWACKFLAQKKLLNKIDASNLKPAQLRFEIKNSIVSILIFGFSILPIVYLVRLGAINQLPNTWYNIVIGLSILTLWNEIHFYLMHRFLHQPFMMKHFHKIHHYSKTPTIYSVYSFHWVEALLLSTVPLTIVPFIPISIIAVFAFPMVSILINFAGHCNYRFGSGTAQSWKLLATHHNQHHSRGQNNFGFALHFLDRLSSKLKKKT